jgi:hypothetical protein
LSTRLVSVLLCLLPTLAYAQRGGAVRPIQNLAESCTDAVEGAACDNPKQWCVDYDASTILGCDPTTRLWTSIGSAGSLGSFTANKIVIGAGVAAPTVSLCSASGNSIDCPATAATGGYIDLKEASNVGSHVWRLKVGDLGLGGQDWLHEIGTDGVLPPSALPMAQAGNVAGTAFLFTAGTGLGGGGDLSGASVTFSTNSGEEGFIGTATFAGFGGASTAGKVGMDEYGFFGNRNSGTPEAVRFAGLPNNAAAGWVLFGDQTDAIDTGTELCTLAGGTCVDTITPAGDTSTQTCSTEHSALYYALCARHS